MNGKFIEINEEKVKDHLGNFVREAKFEMYLKKRGLKTIDMIVSDKSLGLVESIPDFHSKAKWRRCVAHFHRNVLALVSQGEKKRGGLCSRPSMLKENLEEAAK